MRSYESLTSMEYLRKVN